MKVLQINSVCGIRSTGRICTDIADVLKESGDECRIGFGRGKVPECYRQIAIPIGGRVSTILHGVGTRLFDNTGFYSIAATRSFLKCVDSYKPDLVHLHNLHGYYINIKLLFEYIKEKNLPVVWTLHDCWAFTGHCSHFAVRDCQRWKKQCHSCPMRDKYPASLLLDNSSMNHRRKNELFSGIERMQIITPSDWLGHCVEQSFLGQYPIETIQNGVDLSAFHPIESDVSKRYGLQKKKIILGVASTWTEHKGLGKFYRLAELLGEEYQVVLVGLKRTQLNQLPANVLGIERTNSIQELAQLYTAAYVHVSMSQEETMGLTIIEANACGTPVIVFDRTALPEIVTPGTGIVLKECTAEAVAQVLNDVNFSKERYTDACIAHARQFEKKKMYSKYISVYWSMVE